MTRRTRIISSVSAVILAIAGFRLVFSGFTRFLVCQPKNNEGLANIILTTLAGMWWPVAPESSKRPFIVLHPALLASFRVCQTAPRPVS